MASISYRDCADLLLNYAAQLFRIQAKVGLPEDIMSRQEKGIKTAYRACHFCEAICGLEIRLDDNDRIMSIRGDKSDPFSQGYICPKATALQDLHEDPDRLRRPVRRTGDGWEEISWQQALEETAERLVSIANQYGNDAIASYVGNPAVHNYGLLTHGHAFLSLFRSKNRFSATSVDQLPQQLASFLMLGHQLLIPIPDINRTDLMIIIGGNPLASNGSMMTAANFRQRIKDLQQRGGKLVVIDPRRTETANVADQHLFIRPGTDAALLLAMLHTLYAEDLVNPAHLHDMLDHTDRLKTLLQPFTAERAADITGIAAENIKQLARELANTKRAVCYGRMGISVQEYGSVCQWAVYLLNILTGKLDAEGGAMFTTPAWDTAAPGTRAGSFDRYRSRVSGLPEFNGEFPASVLAEEMLTPGEGQIRALVTMAGNPVLSNPNGRQLDRAFEQLDFVVAIDCYINETTRHADIILPPTSPLERNHYDISFNSFAVQNIVRFNSALFDKPEDSYHDWEICEMLAEKISTRLGKPYKTKPSPEQFLDFSLQNGPYGKQTGHPLALDLDKLKEYTHNLDLGPLQPCLPSRLSTENKHINCAPDAIIADLPRVEKQLFAAQSTRDNNHLQLISRRHIRSKNSWMHNYHRLVKGKDRCDLQMNPEDANRLALEEGSLVTITSRTGSINARLTVSDQMMPGVVSLPHGWGHDRPGTQLHIAREVAGVSINDLTDEQRYDPVCGNASLNGISVIVRPLAP